MLRGTTLSSLVLLHHQVFFIGPISPTPTTTRTRVAVNIFTTNWPTSRGSYQSTTNNSWVWTTQVSTEEPDCETSELREYNNHPQAGEVHAAELESVVFVAKRSLTRPAGNVIEVGIHLWRAAVVRWEKQPYNIRSFLRRWEIFFEKMVRPMGCCYSYMVLPRTQGVTVV